MFIKTGQLFGMLQVPQGYNRGDNIHGAPYDFRRAANEHGRQTLPVKIVN